MKKLRTFLLTTILSLFITASVFANNGNGPSNLLSIIESSMRTASEYYNDTFDDREFGIHGGVGESNQFIDSINKLMKDPEAAEIIRNNKTLNTLLNSNDKLFNSYLIHSAVAREMPIYDLFIKELQRNKLLVYELTCLCGDGAGTNVTRTDNSLVMSTYQGPSPFTVGEGLLVCLKEPSFVNSGTTPILNIQDSSHYQTQGRIHFFDFDQEKVKIEEKDNCAIITQDKNSGSGYESFTLTIK